MSVSLSEHNGHTVTIECEWVGPYEWPHRGSHLPHWPGIYLWTFPFEQGYIVYAAGITRRSLRSRFREHTRSYLDGTYNLFDVTALCRGLRVQRWQGFWSKKRPAEKVAEFERRREELRELALDQMAACQIFAAQFPTEDRLLERLEAAIMNQLHNSPKPFSDIPDRGMMLAPRWQSETPITVVSRTGKILYGIQTTFEI